MDTRTVTISSKEIDSAIEVLSSAGQEFQLTRFERFAYRALMVSADVAVACVVLGIPCDVLTGGLEGHLWDPLGARDAAGEMLPLEQVSPAAFFVLMLNLLFSLIFVAASLVAIVSLVLNIPLFRKAGRESARLRELGLSSFSHSLLKESRRGRWINRVRGVLFIGALIYMVLDAVLFFIKERMVGGGLVTFLVLYVIVAFGSLIAARYLRNQRERMELAASAEELRKGFQNLRKRSETGVVSVPAELLEKTATIETAQIAEERKDAIFESVSSRPTGYAIAFDRDAIKQRAMLDVADRIELADLVAQLSIAGVKLEPREGMQGNKTKGNRVEIDYVIDNASRSIRVIAVRRLREVSDASVSGGSHA